MPCNDWGGGPGPHVVYRDLEIHGLRIKDFQALLCGSFTLAEKTGTLDDLLDKMDWKEVGVSRKTTLEWWEKHKKEDELRRKEEAHIAHLKKIERERSKKRREILARLSPEEKDILGF